MAQRLILTLWQGDHCLRAGHHCLKAEHCSLNPYGQSAAVFSGKSVPLQLHSLLVSPSPLLTGQVLERIATEFNQLQFHAVQSKGMPLLDKVRPVSVGWGWAGLQRLSQCFCLATRLALMLTPGFGLGFETSLSRCQSLQIL